MIENREDENLMARYLLGAASAEEAAWLEECSLADYDFFEHMLVIENRLIDEYLADQLAPQQRVQFEQSFLASAKRRERVELARSFLGVIAQVPAPIVMSSREPVAVPVRQQVMEKNSWQERWQNFFGFNNLAFALMASSALLLVAFAGWSFWETRRVREDLAQISRERSAAQQREQELQAKLKLQQGQTEELHRELERSRVELERLKAEEAKLQQSQSQSSLTTFATLMPPEMRGNTSDRVPSLTINSNTNSVNLTLVVNKEVIKALLATYPQVRAELSRQGQIQLRQSGLKPSRVKIGQAFVVRLPAAQLSEGRYQIRLVGVGASGETTIADYLFNLEKK